MKKIQIFAAIAFSFLGGSAAYAGGDYADPAPACGGAFSGFYAGGQLGFGGLQSEVSGGGGSLNFNDRGFTIGGHTGYNWQCDGRLWGVETDMNYFNASGGSSVTGIFPGGLTDTQSFNSDINWFGTLRGRFGFVFDDNFLVYGAAGLAYGGLDHRFSDSFLSFSQSNSDTEIGWTVGGGIEYMIRENWSLRAEGSFVDFGSQNDTYTATGGGCIGVCTTRLNWDDNFWVTRVGLTYHFSQPEPVYTPLK